VGWKIQESRDAIREIRLSVEPDADDDARSVPLAIAAQEKSPEGGAL
jgi:hypothetical protein